MIINNLPKSLAKILYNTDLKILYANEAFYKILGYSQEDYHKKFGSSLKNIIVKDDFKIISENFEKYKNKKDNFTVHFRILKNNNIIWVTLNSEYIENCDNGCIYQCVLLDYLEINKTNNSLETILNNIDSLIIFAKNDNNLTILFQNYMSYDLLKSEKNVNSFKDFIEEFIFSEDAEKLYELLESKKSFSIDCKSYNSLKWIHLNCKYIKNNTEYDNFLFIINDITENKIIKSNLEIEQKKYDIISELADSILFEYDINKDIITYSDKLNNYFDNQIDKEIFIKSFKDTKYIYPKDIKKFLELYQDISRGVPSYNVEARIVNSQNKYIWYNFQGVTLYGENKKPIKVLGKIKNINIIKQESEKLAYKAKRDFLTNLLNKEQTILSINTSINNEKNNNLIHAFLFVDIDNFKDINEHLGYVFGDAILVDISSKLLKQFDKYSILGRIGGDEFIIFVKDIGNNNIIFNIAEQICRIFQNIYWGENNEYKISASIGVSLYPKDGKNYNELFYKADIALCNAKINGKNRYKIYNSDIPKFLEQRYINPIRNVDKFDISKYNYDYGKFISNIIQLLMETKDMHSTIDMIISMLGDKYELSHIYIFENTYKEDGFTNTYEWYNNKKEIFLKSIEIKYEELDQYFKNCDDELLYLGNIKNEDSKKNTLYKFMLKNDTKFFLLYAFKDYSCIKGFIGFESTREFNESEFNSLKLFSKLISSSILKFQYEQKLTTSYNISQNVLNNKELYTYIIDKDFKIIYINSKTYEFFKNAKIGELCYKSIRGENEPCADCPSRSMLPTSSSNTTQYYDKNLKKWVAVTSSKIKVPGNNDAVLICCDNITDYIEKMTYKDSLTGISTLNKFKIDAEMLLEAKQDLNYALLYTDLDKFKYINDTYGYAVGDEVLRSFSTILYSILLRDELICRATDDKFIMLLKYDKKENLFKRLNNINKQISKMEKLMLKKCSLVVISGVYLIKDEDTDISVAIDRANTARKNVKGISHKNSYAVYNKQMDLTLIKEKEIESKMFDAIKNKEFVVYLQPKVELKNKKIIGAEALVRWNSNGKIIPPNNFIPLFERNGFIVNLDFYVYETVLAKMKEWIEKGKKVIPISVNISRAHLKNDKFVEELFNLVKKYDIPINLIELELTESIFVDDMESVIGTMKEFKELGFIVSMDDFGSGFSSLNLLKDLPVDVIKLDKDFFRHSSIEQKESIIVSHVIKMAKDLKMIVLSEGVETAEQAEFLYTSGCDLAQGYLFSRPIPMDEFEKMIEKQN